MTHISQYLQRYAESEIHHIQQFSNSAGYTNVIVIPAYNETDSFFRRFIQSELCRKKILLILVINQPDHETDPSLQILLAQSIRQSGTLLWQEHNLLLIQLNNSAAEVLIVDRFSNNLSLGDKQAVGLARKIGADIATALINMNLIDSPWICSTDADTHLPDNYFSVLDQLPEETSAITYNYRHINDQDAVGKATQLYEQALRYYTSGLAWAGSTYAFHTIGSAIAFRYNYYAMVRGFPKRSAGEDFYLLNKLAKHAAVRTVFNATVKIESRLSHRVPFGTGPAVSKILALQDLNDYHFYHPQVFVELKKCLQQLGTFWMSKNDTTAWFNNLSEASLYALKQLKFHTLVTHIQEHISNEQQCIVHVNQWFDAFKTLKFIHFLQQRYFPAVPFTKAIVKLPFSIQ